MSAKKLQLADFDLNSLVALQALIDTVSVTRAASQIGVSQSAMSHTLRKLRAMFDDELLVRSGARMKLTPRAEAMREPLYRSLLSLQQTIRMSQHFDPARSDREFTVGATDFMQLLFLPGLTGILCREAPALRVRAENVANIESYGTALESGRLDLVIGSILLDEYPGLKRTLLVRESLVCATRSDHPSIGESLSLEEYVASPHLLISPTGKGPGIVDRLLAKHGEKRHVAMRLSSFLVAPWVLASSNYILTAPSRVIELHREFLGLRVWRPPVEIAEVPVYSVWHERSDRDPAVCWLRDSVARAVRGE